MMKLIVSDLDGTLLDPQGNLDKDVFPLLSKLEERGILFVPASGRQHHNLYKLFTPLSEKLVFICENGALVRQGRRTLYSSPLLAERARSVIRAARSVGGLQILLCCENTAFIETTEEPFRTKAHASYTNCLEVDDLEKYLSQETVCKVSIYDLKGSKNYAEKVLPPLLDGVKCVVSGGHWLDVIAPETDKRNALRVVQERFGVTPDECMVFGDQMNDLGMFEVCTHTRAVANAVPEVRSAAKKIIPSNAEKGVFQELEAFLKGENYV